MSDSSKNTNRSVDETDESPFTEAGRSRRTFMRVAAATAGTAGVSGFVSGSGSTLPDHEASGPCAENGTDKIPPRYVELGAFRNGWEAEFPPRIEGEQNPTLEFEAGQPYVIRWTNRDGGLHDFQIRDGEGNVLESTQRTATRGDTRVLRFVASEEMEYYLCSIHPSRMRGNIEFPNGEAPASDYELGGSSDGWSGESPSSIDGQTNPTLELEVGDSYVITWYNRDGECHNFVIHDEDGTAIESTEANNEEGTWESVMFTATDEMVEYVSEPQESAMKGKIVPKPDFHLGAYSDGWEGESPGIAQDGTNPTLELKAGDEYVLKWTNRDGKSHNFAVRDADGNVLTAMETTETKGVSTYLTFTATEEMAEYVSEPHESATSGDIVIEVDSA